MVSKLLAAFLCAALCFGQSLPTIKGIAVLEQTNTSIYIDDTFMTTGWSGTTAGGNFSGGRLFSSMNDGLISGGAGRNIALLEVTALNPYSAAGTTVVVANGMSGYGVQGANCFDGTGVSCKSVTPWFLNNILFWNVYAQDNSSPFDPYRSALIMSPDFGAHWCNWATFSGASYTCTSANWQANGDMPASNSGIQWVEGGDSGLHKMSRFSLVQLCQDNSIGCPVISGIDPSRYIYTISNPSNGTGVAGTVSYLHRMDKQCAPVASPSNAYKPMFAECWTHWDGATWNTLVSAATNLGAIGWGAMWLPTQQIFISMGVRGADQTNLTGSWSPNLFTSFAGNPFYVPCLLTAGAVCHGGFATPILATLTDDSVHGTQFVLSSDSTYLLGKGYFQMLTVNASNARGGAQ